MVFPASMQSLLLSPVLGISIGVYVPVNETLRGFREIIEGKHDDLPESAFLDVGTIDEAVAKAKRGGQA